MKLSVRGLLIVISAGVGVAGVPEHANAQGLDQTPQGGIGGPEQGAPSDATATQAACPAGSQLKLGALVGQALSGVQLRPEQEASLQRIGGELDQAELPVQRARQDLLLAIAGALEQGSVDQATMAPKIGALVETQSSQRPLAERAFVELHDTLDPQQRSTFVDALEAGVQGETTPESASQASPGRELSEEQLQQLRALGAPSQGSAQGQPRIVQLLEAFRGDAFDPATVAPEQGAATNGQERVAIMLNVVEGVTRILTPDQRMDLAATLRASVQCTAEAGAAAGGENVGTEPQGESTAPTGSVTEEARGGSGGGGTGGGMRTGGGFGRGGGVGFGPGMGGFAPGMGAGFGPGMRGFAPGMGVGFGPGMRGFRPGMGMGFGPGMRGFGRAFFPGFNRGFFPGFRGPFFRGFHRGFFVPGFPIVVTQVFAPFVAFAPFAQFSVSFSTSIDISIVIQAMTSTFAFF
jgi:hypothetical protein